MRIVNWRKVAQDRDGLRGANGEALILLGSGSTKEEEEECYKIRSYVNSARTSWTNILFAPTELTASNPQCHSGIKVRMSVAKGTVHVIKRNTCNYNLF